MAPTPQEFSAGEQPAGGKGAGGAGTASERVVISGISGLYPEAHSVKDLADILYNKKNPINCEDPRWTFDHPEVTKFVGKVPEIGLFDAQFFKVHYRLANTMDVAARKNLEQAYKAIYDAGINPSELSGKKVAVYIGSCFCETDKGCIYEGTGFGIAGCNRSMFANRISYSLNLKGPSMAIDDLCCSSTAAVEQAYQAINRGECEAAIVGGSHLNLHPQTYIHFGRVMKLNKDGITKSFDENASGCAKSEAVNVIFLQKAKNALRIYAEIVHIKTEFVSLMEDETGPRYGFFRDPEISADFIRKFYEEAQIPTQAVEFVEAFGSATPEADKQELEAISKVYCKDRSDPLLIGSIMSNIGYAEAAAGINAMVKVILGFHTGQLAGNMHLETPRQDVLALRDGRMRIITDNTPFRRSYVAINGISATGVNAHVLLNGHYKPKDLSRYKSNIPYLVTLSGRQESAVQIIVNDLKSRPVDPEELALFHNIHKTSIPGHLGRGFLILDTNEENKTVSLKEEVDYFDDEKRPLWFVYSGMGSQWAGMGEHLMRIPVFAAAIERCRRVLEPKGVDIVNIITSRDKSIFDNILNSFVGIAAIQIGLTDILREIGLVPDKIIGHSVGELGCAYADGCFTAEEMILSAYSRGLVSVQTPFIRGSMAAVGIGFQQISSMCPPEIEVACHNGPDSCTISGPADVMREFVTHLSSQNIFAKEVPCSNIAYHSRYIAEAGPELLKYLSEVIKQPKLRSERWVSTSVPMDKWDEESAKYSSAEYHTNNLLRPVLFEESSRLVPANAVLVEVAPHGLLQAILKRSLPSTARNVPLTRRSHPDNARLVLEAIGQLYMLGYYPRLEALYPKIEFPVSTGTPMLSHLIEWAHHEKWAVSLYVTACRVKAAATKYLITTHDEEHRYLEGNIVKGKNVFPFAAALTAVWDTLAMSSELPRRQVSVQFREVELHAQPVLHERRQLALAVALHRGTGRFEVLNDRSRVATGFIRTELDPNRRGPPKFEAEDIVDQNTIYQMFSMRDFSYRNEFRSIHSTNSTFSEALIYWRDNWVTLIDGMLQLQVLRHPLDTVSLPTAIRTLSINVQENEKDTGIKVGNDVVKVVNVSDNGKTIRCAGVVMEDIVLRDLPAASLDDNLISLKTLKYIPHFQFEKTDFNTAMHVFLQVVAENINKDVINVLEVVDNGKVSEFKDVEGIICDIPGINSVYKCLELNKILGERDNFLNDFDLLLVSDLATEDHLCQVLYRVLPRDTFIVNKEDTQVCATTRPSMLYRVMCSHNVGSGSLELARWRPTTAAVPSGAINVHSPSDLDLLAATQASLLPQQKLLVLTSYPPIPGLKDLITHWRKTYNRKIYLASINHKISEDQNLDQMPNLDLTFNILDHGKWGGEYYVPLQQKASLGEDVTLRCARVRDIESLYWVPAPKSSESGVKVAVHYAGVNDLDAKRITGSIPFDYISATNNTGFGMDFSGVTETGERVMGIVPRGAISSTLHVKSNQLWPVPSHWSLEDAATVPLAYCLAYYCLGMHNPIHPHMRVLVHSGAGALGQAAISVALAHQCEVFATVSSNAKKRFLLKLFPELKPENVGNSRDLTFGDMVMETTAGKGVNVIITNQTAELKNICFNIGGKSSIIYDINQIYSQEKYDFGMSNLNKERSYKRVDLLTIFKEENDHKMKQLQRLVCEGIARGWVRPLSRAVYGPEQAARAVRLVAAANQRGRALLRLRTPHPTQSAVVTTPAVLPRLQCTPELYHLVICDNDLISIQLAEKLINRGVRKLLLRRFAQSFNLQFKIREWQKNGVEVNDPAENTYNTFNLESNVLSSLEGIYFVFTNCHKNYEFTSMLSSLDALTRQACPALKYFTVISTDESFGRLTCSSRKQDRLPATMIKLPSVSKICDGVISPSRHEEISPRQVASVVEESLCSSESIVMAYVNLPPKPSLLSRIAAIADITIPENVNDTLSLTDLGMLKGKSKDVQLFLLDMCNVALSEEEVRSTTIQMLREIEETLECVEFETVPGLNTFISYVDSDELVASSEMVMMPTLYSGENSPLDEFNVNKTYLCVVPGVEGHYGRFRLLCERLKLPALVLQPGLHHPHETVRDTARRYAEILIDRAGLNTNFYLLGYESGVLVALELAALLEDHGLNGTVFCLGVPPSDFNAELRQHLSGLETEEALQDAVLRHMFALMTGDEGAELDVALRGAAGWRERVEMAVRLLLGRVPHSAQYARQLIDAAHGRLAMLLRHAVEPRALRSRLVLLQPAPAPPRAAALQPHSQQPVAAHALRAPLAHAPQDLRCAAIINSYLDDNILRVFQERNLCESYKLCDNIFMTKLSAIN